MNKITKLKAQDTLPLTCSRNGICCYGKRVMLNPWELRCLAKEKKITTRAFRDLYCEFGGIQLWFNGKAGWRGHQCCSQYIENFGCSVHLGRPLACRLFPLGRQIQNNEVQYIHQGEKFPCLDGCAEVLNLPKLSVNQYLKEQQTDKFEKAQDEYLKLMQNLADIAFFMLLDSGLSESGDKTTLPLWRQMGKETPEALASRIGSEWMDSLMLPDIPDKVENPIVFVTNLEFHQASVLMMGLALHLARSIGANPEILCEHWIETAKSNGAQELL